MDIYLENNSKNIFKNLHPQFSPIDGINIGGDKYSSIASYIYSHSFPGSIDKYYVEEYEDEIDIIKPKRANISKKDIEDFSIKSKSFDVFSLLDSLEKKYSKSEPSSKLIPIYSIMRDNTDQIDKKYYNEGNILDYFLDLSESYALDEIHKSVSKQIDNLFVSPDNIITKENVHNRSLLLFFNTDCNVDTNYDKLYGIGATKMISNKLKYYRDDFINRIDDYLVENTVYDNYCIYSAINYYITYNNMTKINLYINSTNMNELLDIVKRDIKDDNIKITLTKSQIYNKVSLLAKVLLRNNINIRSFIKHNNFNDDIFDNIANPSNINNHTKGNYFDNDTIIKIKEIFNKNNMKLNEHMYINNNVFSEIEYNIIEDISNINILRLIFIKSLFSNFLFDSSYKDSNINKHYNSYVIQIIQSVLPNFLLYLKIEPLKFSMNFLLKSLIYKKSKSIIDSLNTDKDFRYTPDSINIEINKVLNAMNKQFYTLLKPDSDKDKEKYYTEIREITVKNVNPDKPEEKMVYSLFNKYISILNTIYNSNISNFKGKKLENLLSNEYFTNNIDVELYKSDYEKFNNYITLLSNNINNILTNIVTDFYTGSIKSGYGIDTYNTSPNKTFSIYFDTPNINFYIYYDKDNDTNLYVYGDLTNFHRNIFISISQKIVLYGSVNLSYSKPYEVELDDGTKVYKYKQKAKINFGDQEHNTYLDLFYKYDEKYGVKVLEFEKDYDKSLELKNTVESGLYQIFIITRDITLKRIDKFLIDEDYLGTVKNYKELYIGFVHDLRVNIRSHCTNFMMKKLKDIVLNTRNNIHTENFKNFLLSTGNLYININFTPSDITIRDKILVLDKKFQINFQENFIRYYKTCLSDIRKTKISIDTKNGINSNIIFYSNNSINSLLSDEIINNYNKASDNDFLKLMKSLGFNNMSKEKYEYCSYEIYKMEKNILNLYTSILSFIKDSLIKYDKDKKDIISKNYNLAALYTSLTIGNILFIGTNSPNKIGDILSKDKLKKYYNINDLLKILYLSLIYVPSNIRGSKEFNNNVERITKNRKKDEIINFIYNDIFGRYTKYIKNYNIHKRINEIDTDFINKISKGSKFTLFDNSDFHKEIKDDTFDTKFNNVTTILEPACIINYSLISNINSLDKNYNLHDLLEKINNKKNNYVKSYKRYLDRAEIIKKIKNDIQQVSYAVIEYTIIYLYSHLYYINNNPSAKVSLNIEWINDIKTFVNMDDYTNLRSEVIDKILGDKVDLYKNIDQISDKELDDIIYLVDMYRQNLGIINIYSKSNEYEEIKTNISSSDYKSQIETSYLDEALKLLDMNQDINYDYSYDKLGNKDNVTKSDMEKLRKIVISTNMRPYTRYYYLDTKLSRNNITQNEKDELKKLEKYINILDMNQDIRYGYLYNKILDKENLTITDIENLQDLIRISDINVYTRYYYLNNKLTRKNISVDEYEELYRLRRLIDRYREEQDKNFSMSQFIDKTYDNDYAPKRPKVNSKKTRELLKKKYIQASDEPTIELMNDEFSDEGGDYEYNDGGDGEEEYDEVNDYEEEGDEEYDIDDEEDENEEENEEDEEEDDEDTLNSEEERELLDYIQEKDDEEEDDDDFEYNEKDEEIDFKEKKSAKLK